MLLKADAEVRRPAGHRLLRKNFPRLYDFDLQPRILKEAFVLRHEDSSVVGVRNPIQHKGQLNRSFGLACARREGDQHYAKCN